MRGSKELRIRGKLFFRLPFLGRPTGQWANARRLFATSVTGGGTQANYCHEGTQPVCRVRLIDDGAFRAARLAGNNPARRRMTWRVEMKMSKLTMIMSVSVLGVSVLAHAQTAQAPDQKPMPPASNQQPKTRAQVRAELEQARMDGTISRYGNPDPY